jgi:hypothetical protein
MADITYTDKVAASTFTHENANEIKSAVNSKVDKETGKVLSDNNYSTAEKNKVTAVTPPAAGTLITGSNAINLTNIAGQEYHPYNMTSGNLTITVGANPVAGASAHFIKIADGSHTFVSTAFTTLSGEDDNTNGVKTHCFISYKLNSSDVLTGFIQFVQEA